MQSALLRNGDLKDYTALGRDGMVVYSVAPQLREAIKYRLDRKNGTNYTDFLAIPQRNDQGSHIDWYIPFESERNDNQYLIVPWNSTTSTERQEAYELLHNFEKEALQLGQSLLASSAQKGDQLLFARLLCDGDPNNISDPENLTALRYPNPEHIYIVNGRPVITFWGFTDKNGLIQESPFFNLKPIMPAVTTSAPIPAPITSSITPDTAIEKKKHRGFWWLWLLPLLLLALILLAFLLRDWWLPKVGLTSPVSASAAPLIDKEHRDIPQERNLETIHDEDNNQLLLIESNNDILGREARNFTPEDTLTPVNEGFLANSEDTFPVVDDNTLPLAQEPVTDGVLNAEISDSFESAIAPEAESSDVKARAQQPLQLNQDSLNSDNLTFLDGRWNAGTGIQDSSTGKPLRLSYEFSDGQGQVEVQRGDGVTCKGDVSAAMVTGALHIDSKSISNCSDGSTYQLPNIQCLPGATDIAECRGLYDNGKDFPVTIKTQ